MRMEASDFAVRVIGPEWAVAAEELLKPGEERTEIVKVGVLTAEPRVAVDDSQPAGLDQLPLVVVELLLADTRLSCHFA